MSRCGTAVPWSPRWIGQWQLDQKGCCICFDRCGRVARPSSIAAACCSRLTWRDKSGLDERSPQQAFDAGSKLVPPVNVGTQANTELTWG